MIIKSITSLGLVLFMGILSSQAQKNTVVSGGEATGSGGIASFSIGQIDYIAAVGSSASANQGLQQPYEFYTVGIEGNEEISLEMVVYPNPTESIINLRVEEVDFNDLTFKLFDVNGRLLLTDKIDNTITTIPMEHLYSATYILMVSRNSSEIKSFLIIKN